MAQSDLKKHFLEHGWIHVKGVFSAEEIANLREAVYETKRRNFKGDLLSNPLLHHIPYDDRILAIVREILGDDPVYFGDANFLVNNKQWGFHKDVPDRHDQNAPDWRSHYTVLRTGIYLQDHIKSSGGLVLRDKSHNSISINVGKPFNVPIEKGDFLAWNLRTTHSGHAKMFKIFPKFMINPKYYRLFPQFVFIPDKTERILVSVTYGKQDEHMERYLKYLASRVSSVNYIQNSIYDPQILAEAEKHGLKVINMCTEEIMKLKPEDLNLHHKDIPY